MNIILPILFIVASGLQQPDLSPATYGHIVVIPDIHGDLEALFRSLWLAVKRVNDGSVIDYESFKSPFYDILSGSSSFSGPSLSLKTDVAVVQLGDIVDRGPYGMQCLIVLGMIETVIGWPVINLYGNHEIINFLDQAHMYVSEREWAIYDNSPEFRRERFGAGSPFHQFASRNFLGMARVVSSHDPRANTLFVHGGINQAWINHLVGSDKSNDLSEINRKIQEMANNDLEGLNHMDSILWTRFLSEGPEAEVCPYVDTLTTHYNVARIVLGHTPQEDDLKAKNRCEGKIILADVMMSRWMFTATVDESNPMGGRPMALVMTFDKESETLSSIVAHYTDLVGELEESSVLYGDSALEVPPNRPIVRLIPPTEHGYDEEDSTIFADDEFIGRPPSPAFRDEDEENIPPPPPKLVPVRPTARRMYPAFPVVHDVLAEHESGSSLLLDAVFQGISGVTMMFVDQSALNMDVLETVGEILEIPILTSGQMPLMVPALGLNWIGPAPHPYIHIGTKSVMLLQDVVTLSESVEAAIDGIVAKLHTSGYVIGFRSAQSLLDAFGIATDTRHIQLIDWTHARMASLEDIQLEREVITQAKEVLRIHSEIASLSVSDLGGTTDTEITDNDEEPRITTTTFA